MSHETLRNDQRMEIERALQRREKGRMDRWAAAMIFNRTGSQHDSRFAE